MEIAQLYTSAQRSFVAMCDGLADDDWGAEVPCHPAWTVWDVLAHVAGVTDDIVHGRVEGAATDPWTAAQVERWRDAPRVGLPDDRTSEIVRFTVERFRDEWAGPTIAVDFSDGDRLVRAGSGGPFGLRDK